jgi:hypothetical protein
LKRTLALLLTLITACSSADLTPPPVTELPARPANTPDYYLLGFSGRCGVPGFGVLEVPDGPTLGRSEPVYPTDVIKALCDPIESTSYLQTDGAMDDLARVYTAHGKTVKQLHYVDFLYNIRQGTRISQYGFLQAETDLKAIRAAAVDGVRNPSKIVLVAHSHGVVWSHIIADLFPTLPVEAQVDLDGVCLKWSSDHRGFFDDYFADQGGNPWPWDISRPCDLQFLPPASGRVLDISNQTSANVKLNVEAQSKTWQPSVNDNVTNAARDPSRTVIVTKRFATLGHSGVNQPGSASLEWVKSMLDAQLRGRTITGN